MKLGENLLKYRKLRGLTQDEMAEKMQVSRQSVSKWENGETIPELAKLVKLADILDVSIDELCGRTLSTSDKRVKEENFQDVKPIKKSNKFLQIGILVLCLLVGGVGGFFIASSQSDEDTAYELPASIEVTGVTFTKEVNSNQVRCEFVPSIYSDELNYSVSRTDFYGKQKNCEVEFLNGVGTAIIGAYSGNHYKITLEISNGEESRVITLADDMITFYEDGTVYLY